MGSPQVYFMSPWDPRGWIACYLGICRERSRVTTGPTRASEILPWAFITMDTRESFIRHQGMHVSRLHVTAGQTSQASVITNLRTLSSCGRCEGVSSWRVDMDFSFLSSKPQKLKQRCRNRLVWCRLPTKSYLSISLPRLFDPFIAEPGPWLLLDLTYRADTGR